MLLSTAKALPLNSHWDVTWESFWCKINIWLCSYQTPRSSRFIAQCDIIRPQWVKNDTIHILNSSLHTSRCGVTMPQWVKTGTIYTLKLQFIPWYMHGIIPPQCIKTKTISILNSSSPTLSLHLRHITQSSTVSWSLCTFRASMLKAAAIPVRSSSMDNHRNLISWIHQPF